MPESLNIPARFNGPLESGNGGYASGAIAGLLGGPAEVNLRRPVPLDRELEVVRSGEGEDSLQVRDGEALIADARATPDFELDPPAPVSVGEARAAVSRYRGARSGLFSRCFVCGLARDDAFGVFAGEVEGRGLVASPWTPPSWTAGSDRHVRQEFVWAVLDCPTYFALYMEGEMPAAVLARLTARSDGPVVAGREHVVIAWPLEADGRKRYAGSAVLSADGEALAVAYALLIEPRGPSHASPHPGAATSDG